MQNQIIGKIHSFESMGTVDGPGIRFVVFMQGCPLRCLYCHNPDTWQIGVGREITVDEIYNEFEKTKHFYTSGGITVSGGEALIQMEFVTSLFKKFKENNIHTCLDTSGITFNKKSKKRVSEFDELMKYTDLILLDLKQIYDDEHIKLVGASNKNVLDFALYLSEKNIPVWIRHVVVPGYTDNKKEWFDLGYFLGNLRNIKALDILPYHTMGIVKYEQLGIPYPLDGVDDAPKELAAEASKIIFEGMKQRRLDLKNQFQEKKSD